MMIAAAKPLSFTKAGMAVRPQALRRRATVVVRAEEGAPAPTEAAPAPAAIEVSNMLAPVARPLPLVLHRSRLSCGALCLSSRFIGRACKVSTKHYHSPPSMACVGAPLFQSLPF